MPVSEKNDFICIQTNNASFCKTHVNSCSLEQKKCRQTGPQVIQKSQEPLCYTCTVNDDSCSGVSKVAHARV